MYQKIIKELETYKNQDFANWIKPYLSINENSTEEIWGIRVPILRNLAKKYKNILHKDLILLLTNCVHEQRALALFIMILKSKKEPLKMCEIYLDNLEYINNWDLIDYTAPHIVAPNVEKTKLKELAQSDYLWANRVAMVSTIYYIKQKDYSLTLDLAKRFMKHPHHLMHKASGWMLREVGKQDRKTLEDFLLKNEKNMPSIMKSYAKEKLR